MIGYVMVGTNNLERAQKFFDAVFGEMGAKRGYETERMTGWSNGKGPTVMAVTPHDEKAATVGNGSMIALAATSPDEVRHVHAKAMALGAKDEGAPGFRPTDANSGFYGGYFRDLDGNKFVAFCMVPKK